MVEVQEWHSPPLPGAGQFALPKVPRSGAQVAPALQWTPRGTRAMEDHYDDEDSDPGLFRDPQEATEQAPATPDTPSTPEEQREGLGIGTVSLEASLEVQEAVGGCCRLLVGPFGARRTCYHCRPQVKRCAAAAASPHHSCPAPPSLLPCARWRTSRLTHRYPTSCMLSSLHPTSPSHTRRKSTFSHLKLSRSPFTPDLPRSFGCLLRRGCTARRDTLPPRNYERVLWRLTPHLWRRLELCLAQLGDTDTLSVLTPVMYSLRRLQGMAPGRLVYSPSGDSYGDTEREREDLVCAVCICCVALFLCRVWEGMSGLLAEILGLWML
ncbi:hypothetical protein E2C01_001193 [Portunus trituberculatus]|uniref:Uncharacterized protein n=1 Tax=Portunus trituberculatus TaxID=210409 RepID=A0A5B7CIS9_PORTR|nr:hypothetical protein [Portunus trituberculatus]